MIRICDHVKGEAILLDTSTTLEDELEVSFDAEGNSFPTESSNAEADGPSLDAVDNVIRVMETEETEVLMTSLDEGKCLEGRHCGWVLERSLLGLKIHG